MHIHKYKHIITHNVYLCMSVHNMYECTLSKHILIVCILCMNECYKLLLHPLQVAPSISSRNPLLHPQVKPPLAFVDIWEQPSVSLLHSSISRLIDMYVCLYCPEVCLHMFVCKDYICIPKGRTNKLELVRPYLINY